MSAQKRFAAHAIQSHRRLQRTGSWRPDSGLTLDRGPGHGLAVDQNSGQSVRDAPLSKTLPISEVKARLPELVAGVMERGEGVVVTKNGRPAAVLVNVGEYERLKETLDVLSDPELMRQIRASERYFAKGGKGLTFEETFNEPQRGANRRTRRQ